MSERLVNVDRETPMLLPTLTVNQRGSGNRQYPPLMMLTLEIHCCANSVISSRRIEAATYRDLAVRYLTGDTHPARGEKEPPEDGTGPTAGA